MGIIDTARKIAKVKDAIPPLKIHEPEKMEAILQALIKEKNPLEIAIDIRLQRFYSNRAIRVGNDQGVPALVIDTVLPEEHGRHALKTSEFIEVSFRLGGDPYTFQSRFLSMGGEKFSTVFIAYPKTIYRYQFRTAERFYFTPDDPPVFVTTEYAISANTSGRETAVATDISMDGLSFSTANNRLSPETLIRIEIEIPEASPIQCKAVVTQLTDLKEQEFPYKCGIHFEGLSKIQKESVSRFIQNEKKSREGRDENIFDIDRITRIALHKTKIRARLEGREISQQELEDMKDFLEFKNIDLDESLDL